MLEYCEPSYFEALVNALVHRDYLVNGSEVRIDMFDDRMVIYSPGGMMDGTLVQDRIIDSIPSTRRNPILGRCIPTVRYMERKGSGLTKIINAYQNANNYDESKVPQFISSRVEFTVILKNLNYGLSGDEEYEIYQTSQRVEEYKRRTEEVFLNALCENPYISRKLKNKGLIEHARTAGGDWKVLWN